MKNMRFIRVVNCFLFAASVIATQKEDGKKVIEESNMLIEKALPKSRRWIDNFAIVFRDYFVAFG